MNDNCITRFEVSNFKKFDHLVVENIGQVNLITGDNNVGKTTLLEALLCNDNNLRWICYLHQMLFYRGIIINPTNMNTVDIKFPKENFLKYIFKDIDKRLVCKYTDKSGLQNELGIENKTIGAITQDEFRYRRDKYNIANVKDWVMFYKNGKPDELQWLYFDDLEIKTKPVYWPYIGIDTPYSQDIRNYELTLSKEMTNGIEKNNVAFDYSDKQNIIRLLQVLMIDIVDYMYLPFGEHNIHAIANNKDGKYHPITTYGDGFQKYFRYLLTILHVSKIGDKRLMIDEIDVGVHYLKMKDEWKAIFQLAQQTGIQIFATTHSMDCIQAFVEAGQENESINNDLRLIELEEFTSNEGINKHLATTFTHSQLEASLNSDLNVRGGKLW